MLGIPNQKIEASAKESTMKCVGKVIRISLFCGAIMTSLGVWADEVCKPATGKKYWESRLYAPANEFGSLQVERESLKKKVDNKELSAKDREAANQAFFSSGEVTQQAYQRYMVALMQSGVNVDITTGNDISKHLVALFDSDLIGYKSSDNSGDVPQLTPYEPNNSTLPKNQEYYVEISPYPDNDAVEVQLTFSDYAINQCEKQLKCTSDNGNACVVFVSTWAAAADSVKNPERNDRLDNLKKGLIAGESEWERFFKESRYQYLWEKSVTAWAYSDKLKEDRFVPPPPYQIHLLRPWVVMEYVGNASDGSQFEGALSLEVIGINYWNGGYRSFDWIGFPFGVSAVLTFSDRAGVDDVAYGAMFHALNSYSFGVTARSSGEVGVFLTADLLKVFSDKKSEVEYWGEKIDEYAP